VKIFAARAGDFPDQGWIVERVGGELRLLKQYAPETQRRDRQHRHGYGQNTMPVLGFDLHRTLTPDIGYPLISEPFPGVKDGLDSFVARGCCIHIVSASLDFPDQDINDARTRILWQWVRDNGLPVGFVGPNSEATIRLDDRAVTVPENPDWPSLFGLAEKMLKKIYELDKTGRYVQRQDLKPAGDMIDDDSWPDDEDVPQDAPRGFTTPLIDVDMHRTLMPAWGTRRDAKPNPDGVRCMREWYNAGYTIQVSCGGWNPALVEKPQFAVDRAAWQRRYLRQWGIPYDRLVAKDDVDVWFDDRAINYSGSWADADTQIRARTGPPASWPSQSVGAIPSTPIK
jgi:hypothetical protein